MKQQDLVIKNPLMGSAAVRTKREGVQHTKESQKKNNQTSQRASSDHLRGQGLASRLLSVRVKGYKVKQ